ncbi:MAG TPA: hypothetical protein VGB95_01145 [Chitinophagales bacterium]
MPLYIQNFVRIKNRSVNFNGKKQKFEAENAKEFAEKIYRGENIEYPRFFKMDMLSKLGLLATEFVLKGEKIDLNTSLVFANVSASLDTDLLYSEKVEKTGKDFQPSPALFVYTLPNIVMGEVCIKHKIQGENIFYIMPNFDPSVFWITVNSQVTLGKATSFILAWVEILEEDFDIFACLLNSTKGEKKFEFSNTALKLIYNGTNIT